MPRAIHSNTGHFQRVKSVSDLYSRHRHRGRPCLIARLTERISRCENVVLAYTRAREKAGLMLEVGQRNDGAALRRKNGHDCLPPIQIHLRTSAGLKELKTTLIFLVAV